MTNTREIFLVEVSQGDFESTTQEVLASFSDREEAEAYATSLESAINATREANANLKRFSNLDASVNVYGVVVDDDQNLPPVSMYIAHGVNDSIGLRAWEGAFAAIFNPNTGEEMFSLLPYNTKPSADVVLAAYAKPDEVFTYTITVFSINADRRSKPIKVNSVATDVTMFISRSKDSLAKHIAV